MSSHKGVFMTGLFNLGVFLAFFFSSANASFLKFQISPDFFVQLADIQSQNKPTDASSTPLLQCRQQITKSVCLIDAKDSKARKNRACQPGVEPYVKEFEAVFDALPALLSRMFCSVDTIWIDPTLKATGNATLVYGADGAVVGAHISVRKSILDEKPTFSRWATWKEQLPFGGNKVAYESIAGLPFVKATHNSNVYGLLFYVMIHEFGHLLDFMNDVNKYNDDGFDKSFESNPQSFGFLSWRTTTIAKSNEDFPGRRQLAYYNVETPITRDQIIPLFTHFFETSFITLYASTNPWDDFAESLAMLLYSQVLNGSFVMDTAQGKSFDLTAKLQLPQFSQKRQYVENFLKRTDLKYPPLQ